MREVEELPEFKQVWENKVVKIISRSGEEVDRVTTDVLWRDDSTQWLEIEYKGKKIPCLRLHLDNPPRIDYEAYV